MIGPHWFGVIITIGVILGGTIMNLRIIRHSEPLSASSDFALHTFIYVFCSLSIILLILTATTDPGIVFPNGETSSMQNNPEIEFEKEIESQRMNKVPNSSGGGGDSSSENSSQGSADNMSWEDMEENSRLVFLSNRRNDIPDRCDYCEICSVVQEHGRKIRHCMDCGYCIEGLDHHCPWMVRKHLNDNYP